MNRATLAITCLVLPGIALTVFVTTGAARPKAVELAGVAWYSDLTDAKKPLLILQMMGKLDDAFC